ncbi:MAG: type I DNA topoisomerase [Candidatus Omnitrophica bacterium]|nr:type I DNA topoisomerase [Candidatus Omnitrophota bacterium]
MTTLYTPITIRLNGEKKVLEKSFSLDGLLAELSIPKERVAVELNGTILSKEELREKILKANDEVEIVHFVGGGAKASEAGGLVIVESPAKCKTIHKYLGPDFEVTASMGHIIDLPKSKMGIDIGHDFKPQYIVMRDKKKTLSDLKEKAKKKERIYLACDPDREGEAISWHLKEELGRGKKVSRVVFNEITQEAVRKAFERPKDIDMNLVDAQQARRVVDRLVGYSLSPLLWQKVGKGLSAGRVQSVALRLVVDRERQIRAFVPEEYWSIEAELKKKTGGHPSFIAKLEKIGGEKASIAAREKAEAVLARAKNEPFVVREIKKQKKKRNPFPPYTTSKLQQAAYNVLRFPASKTMRVAQMLYEGVDVGSEGSAGLITYMRTDSVRVSEGALKEVRQFISKNYGKNYLPPAPNIYKSKKQAQEAHEAIRPTAVSRRPKDIEQYLTPDQFKLYSLIWEQFVSSQMMPGILAQETADIAAGDCLFRATGSRVEFPGCLAAFGRKEEEDSPLPPLAEGETLVLIKIEPHQHFTKPPARFTDASLVKALEEKGIGRPSTYAPIILTLTSRDYIRREGGSLVPTELGILVTDLLVKYFAKLMDFEFTANMEEELDLIEEGKTEWVGVVRGFYGSFSGQLDFAKDKMETVKKENEPTNEVCEKCGKPMVIKWGRHGRFVSCSGWPDCKNAKSLSTGVACPQCGKGQLVRRKAKSGRGRSFYGCTAYPDCTYIANRLPSEASAKEGTPSAPLAAVSGNDPGDG